MIAAHPWVVPLGEMIALAVGAWILRAVVFRRLHSLASKTHNHVDDALVNLADRAITPALILGIAALGLSFLPLTPSLQHASNRILLVAILAVVLYYASAAVQLLVDAWLSRRVASESTRDPIRFASRVLFAAFAVMIVLDKLGISLTAYGQPWESAAWRSPWHFRTRCQTSSPAFTFGWTTQSVSATISS
jgi:small-conductance mechanosensitive channel